MLYSDRSVFDKMLPVDDNEKQVYSTLANSEDPDEMPHKAAFHQGLHCLLR